MQLSADSHQWPIEKVLLCLENMGIVVGLKVVGRHRWERELTPSQQDFIDTHYPEILRHLVNKRINTP